MIDYTAYMAFGITVSIIVFAIMILLFKFVEKPDLTPIKQFDAEKLKAELPPVGRDEKIIVTVFLAVIVFWVLPGILKFFWPAGADFISSLGTCTPPMIGLVLLCIITNEGKPIMDIGDALKNGVPWGSIIMAVVVIAIGAALTLPEAGVTSWLTSLLSPLVQGLAPWLVILLFIAWAIIQTNVSSNMVTITVVYTVAIPLALASGGTINAAAMACIIGAASSFALATPVATAHIAIACGSPWMKVSALVKYGTMLAIASIIVLFCVGYPILSALLPAISM